MTPPRLEFVLEARVDVGEPVDLGAGQMGTRRVVPITGGSFRGPGLEGIVIPGGADWQLIRPGKVVELEARYVLQTTPDNARIAVVNRCLRHGRPEVIEAMLRGEPVSASDYYFRTSPVFTAPSGPYEWLNDSIFVGSGERERNRVILRVWRVA